MSEPSETEIHLNEGDAVVRVHFDDETSKVSVVRMAGARLGDQDFEVYDSGEELPELIQERIAVLDAVDSEENTEWLPEIGKRIDSLRYWMVFTKEDNEGLSL